MSVTLTEWTALLEKEYFSAFIPSGGAAVKIAVASEERAPAILDAVAQAAERHQSVAARVDAEQTRVHMIEKIFFEVARQIDWDALAERWLRAQFRANGYDIPPEQSLHDVEAIAAARGARVQDVHAEVGRWIVNGVLRDYRLGKEFRTAMAMLCHARINPQNVSPSDADVIKEWLRGEKANLTALKRAQIFQRIARHNARLQLASLAIWLRETGEGGLLLLLDARAVTRDLAPGAAPLRYTRNSTLDFYEVLRQFIDDTDEVEHLMVVVVAAPEILEHPKKSVDNYAALKMRTADEVRDRNRSNPLNVLVRIEK
jgi:hypothetical protein